MSMNDPVYEREGIYVIENRKKIILTCAVPVISDIS